MVRRYTRALTCAQTSIYILHLYLRNYSLALQSASNLVRKLDRVRCFPRDLAGAWHVFWPTEGSQVRRPLCPNLAREYPCAVLRGAIPYSHNSRVYQFAPEPGQPKILRSLDACGALPTWFLLLFTYLQFALALARHIAHYEATDTTISVHPNRFWSTG